MKQQTTLFFSTRQSLKFFGTAIALFAMTNSWSQIYSNGGLSTGPTSNSGAAAPTGYTWSEVQSNTGNTTESNTSSGYSGNYTTLGTTSYQLADDFVVPAGQQWSVTSFDFYLYQTASTGTVPPIDQLRIQIYNGDPSLGTSTVVAGNMTTNVYVAANSSDGMMYRTFNSSVPVTSVPGTTRKIWKVRGNLTATLASGTYWVVYQAHATNDATLFFPSVTIPGSRGLAGWNAKQSVLGVWAAIVDDGNPASAPDFPQDFPFQINGTTLGVAENSFSSAFLLYPNPATTTLQIQVPTDVAVNSIEIYDLTGRMVKNLPQAASEVLSINVSDIASGNYLLRVKTDTGIAVKKFAKN